MAMLRLLLLAAALALGACASVKTKVVPLGATTPYPPTQNVEVFLQKPARPHVEVALIESRGEIGVTEADLLNDAREKAKALGADAIVKTDTERVYHRPVPVYDPWYDPLFYGYYRYRPFPPFIYPWAAPYHFVGGGVSYVLKVVAIRYRDAS